MKPDDRRAGDRPNDWLFDTLSRMEESEQRHSSELRVQMADVLRKLEAHIADDGRVQTELKLDIQSLKQTREDEANNAKSRQAWIISLTSVATACAVWLVNAIFGHPK